VRRADRALRFSEEIACAFCETTAPVREFMREQGWPEVDLIARIT
jgi:hypothetical protein